MHLAPGGPLAVYTLNPTVTAQDIERVKHEFGLDQPVYVQYVKWAGGMVDRPLGLQLLRRPAGARHRARAAAGDAGADGIEPRAGARHRRRDRHRSRRCGAIRVFDYATAIAAMLALSLPTFWFGLLAHLRVRADVSAGCRRAAWRARGGGGLARPAAASAAADAGAGVRAGRAMEPLHALRHDRDPRPGFHPHRARQGPVAPTRVLLGHGLRAALVPLVTLAGLQLPLLVGGALVTETVFSWPGMGLLFVNALGTRDYPVLMAILMVGALVVVLGNLLADVADRADRSAHQGCAMSDIARRGDRRRRSPRRARRHCCAASLRHRLARARRAGHRCCSARRRRPAPLARAARSRRHRHRQPLRAAASATAICSAPTTSAATC